MTNQSSVAMAVIVVMASCCLWLGLTSAFVAPRMQPLPGILDPSLAMTQQLEASKESAEDSRSHAQIPLVGLGLVLCAGAAMIGLRKGQAGGCRPAAVPSSVVAVHAFENELGVQAPVGFWDPLGFCKDGDMDAFYRRRCTEIKHGRISMIACIGYIVPEYVKFPGFCSTSAGIKFETIPNGLEALSKVPLAGWAQIFHFCGFCEIYAAKQAKEDPPGKLSGNAEGFGPANYGALGIFKGEGISDPEKKKRSLNAELANGRLAMFAIMGMMFQNGVTGSTGAAMYFPSSAFESELGVTAPLGFWDPLGMSKDGDVKKFNRRRASELKHGRICMYACLGYIVPEYFRMPGFCSVSESVKFTDIPNGLAALGKVPEQGGVQIFFFCGFLETVLLKQESDRAPGDFWTCGNLGIPYAEGVQDPEARKRSLNAELNNGRLAMVAIMGMMFQDGVTGTTGPAMWFPASAFENELGVQAPFGFWDPIGFTADGDVASFKRRRSVELKHSRICMLACMGYLTPEITGKLPGYLSPSAGLKFEDIPNGLGAISKVPALGWAQIVAYFGFVEIRGGFEDYKEGGTPGDYGWKLLTSADPVEKTRKLQCELANGRLAMTAIMAMIFQNGVTGTTGPEMWGLRTNTGILAFENELGVQAPFGFWDPIGFTADGDVASFKRRRSVELKHSRICMLACMGYLTPEITGKLPGYLSPSAGLEFQDIPNGLGAISKVPALGWAQIVAYFGFVEIRGGFEDYKEGGTPGDYGWKLLTSADPVEKTRKLQCELANGRLAMTAIMAMIFQNGVTGTTGPEMWGLRTNTGIL